MTEQVAAQAQRLGQVSGELQAMYGWLEQVGSAADETEAAGACSEMAQAWALALQAMGQSTDGLAAAVAAAAECYAVTDATAMPEQAGR